MTRTAAGDLARTTADISEFRPVTLDQTHTAVNGMDQPHGPPHVDNPTAHCDTDNPAGSTEQIPRVADNSSPASVPQITHDVVNPLAQMRSDADNPLICVSDVVNPPVSDIHNPTVSVSAAQIPRVADNSSPVSVPKTTHDVVNPLAQTRSDADNPLICVSDVVNPPVSDIDNLPTVSTAQMPRVADNSSPASVPKTIHDVVNPLAQTRSDADNPHVCVSNIQDTSDPSRSWTDHHDFVNGLTQSAKCQVQLRSATGVSLNACETDEQLAVCDESDSNCDDSFS